MGGVKDWLRKRLVPGAPSSFLDQSYTAYSDILSKNLNEKKRQEETIQILVYHILDNDYIADPVGLMFEFIEKYPEMSIEELVMLMFKVGISIKDYVDDREVFLSTVKGIKDLPPKYQTMVDDMEMQINADKAAKNAFKEMDTTRFEQPEPIQSPPSKEFNIQSKLKSMSSGELNDLLNELITVMEKKEDQLKRIEETNKRSREKNGGTKPEDLSR